MAEKNSMEPHRAEAILNTYHLQMCDAFCKATCEKFHEDYNIRHVENGCVPNCCKPMAVFSETIKQAYDSAVEKIYK